MTKGGDAGRAELVTGEPMNNTNTPDEREAMERYNKGLNLQIAYNDWERAEERIGDGDRDRIEHGFNAGWNAARDHYTAQGDIADDDAARLQTLEGIIDEIIDNPDWPYFQDAANKYRREYPKGDQR